jgi:tetratricopeptide (TPR) repeat protein
LKKLTTKQQPFYEAYHIINEILESNRNDARILKHLLSFAEYQFRKEALSVAYRESGDEERINWLVDFNVLHKINSRLFNFIHDNSLSSINIYDSVFCYLERSLSLLNPWLIYFDSDAGSQSNSFNEIPIDSLLEELIRTEEKMAVMSIDSMRFEAAEGHCQRSLSYSRRIGVEDEEKTTWIFSALSNYTSLRERQGNLSDAVTFAEEAYNLVVEAYDPVHPQVQKAAGVMIGILSRKGDFYNAERYAEVTYSNLCDEKNGMNQEGEEMAGGAHNLADVIYRQRGDLARAEELARKALRIRTLISGNNQNNVAVSCLVLANILMVQGKLGDETRILFERTLNTFVREGGLGGINTAIGNMSIAVYYQHLAEVQTSVESKRTQLLLAKSYFEEAMQIQSSRYGPTHPETIQVYLRWDVVVKELDRPIYSF